MRDVTVLVPSRNRRDLLEALLPKLRLQSVPPAEILVADDGSSDGSAEAAARVGARVIVLERPAGFAAAVNRGLREIRTPWVAVLNNDVEPAEDWLERLLHAAESHSAWFACGKLLQRADPRRIDGTFDALCRGGCAWRAGHGRPEGAIWNQPRRISFAGFTAALLRRELFEKIGYLDERFQSYLEDVEFCLRCALAGYGGIYVPQARGLHTGSATLGRWCAQTVRLIARNQLLLVAKHYPEDWRRRYGRAVLAAQALWGLVAARHGRLLAYLQGKQEGIRMFRLFRAGSDRRADPERLAAVLAESEAEILRLQRRTGWDAYWRLYFWTAGKRESGVSSQESVVRREEG